jgi:hypothetical protein
VNKCSVPECGKVVVANGLCGMHRMRVYRHGHLENTRAKDWGAREKHPLYGNWTWMRRARVNHLPDEWRDFWKFVEDVGERPSVHHRIAKVDQARPLGKDNFVWQQRRDYQRDGETRSEYMARRLREYRKERPDKQKHSSLWKKFHVPLETFTKLHEQQGGVCAICKKPEVAIYKGRTRMLALDHNHETGAIRGLLCTQCNQGIGSFKDSPALLRAAADYLESWEKKAETTHSSETRTVPALTE